MGKVGRGRGPVYEPTSYDISQACERLQGGWSERERLKRSGGIEEHWTAPLIDDSNLQENSKHFRQEE